MLHIETRYLVESANQIYALVGLHPQPSPDDLFRATHVGCEALQTLRRDQSFFQVAREFRSRRDANIDEFYALTGDLRYFVHNFERIERKVLLAAGLDAELTDHLLDEARVALGSIRSWEGDEQALRWIVERLGEEVCGIRGLLLNGHKRRNLKRVLRRVAFGTGGAAMIGINTASLAGTLGLTAPGAAVSEALGGILLGAALPGGS